MSRLMVKILKIATVQGDDYAAGCLLSSNMIVNFNDETNFPYRLLLTNREVENQVLKHFQIIYQLILSYQKLNYLK